MYILYVYNFILKKNSHSSYDLFSYYSCLLKFELRMGQLLDWNKRLGCPAEALLFKD